MSRSLNIKTCNMSIVRRSSFCRYFPNAPKRVGVKENKSKNHCGRWSEFSHEWFVRITYWHTRHKRLANGSKWKLNQLNRGRALVAADAADVNDDVVAVVAVVIVALWLLFRSRNIQHTKYWLSLRWHCLLHFSLFHSIQYHFDGRAIKRTRKSERNRIGIAKRKQRVEVKAIKKRSSKPLH